MTLSEPEDYSDMYGEEYGGQMYGGAYGGAAFGPGSVRTGLPFDPAKLLNEKKETPTELRPIRQTEFKVEFVWKPMSSLQRAKFAVLHDLFSKRSSAGQDGEASTTAEPGLAEANEHIKNFEQLGIEERHKERLRRDQLEITQEEFDRFLKSYRADQKTETTTTTTS